MESVAIVLMFLYCTSVDISQASVEISILAESAQINERVAFKCVQNGSETSVFKWLVGNNVTAFDQHNTMESSFHLILTEQHVDDDINITCIYGTEASSTNLQGIFKYIPKAGEITGKLVNQQRDVVVSLQYSRVAPEPVCKIESQVREMKKILAPEHCM